jgi:4,5-dihydroxyphthalate decarboxylase
VTKLQLSLACCDYDRTQALMDGRVAVEGCEIVACALDPIETFHRAFRYQEFDVTELSLSGYASQVARGDNVYVAIPVFPSRLFRHAGIYVRTDRGIAAPADLRGKTVGVPDYQITANVWIRGMLQDEYGLRPSELRWRQGGVEDPGRTDWAELNLPPDIEYQPIPHNCTLSQMLEVGGLDAMLSALAPSCFLSGAPHVGRLFPDYRAAEEAYFRRTRLFPIMHVIGIRRSIVEQHPWIATNLYKGFVQAKRIAIQRLGQIGHLYTSLPWSVSEYEGTRALMGEDFWPYGVAENEAVLGTFLRYHFEQGLSSRLLMPTELFVPSTGQPARL